MDAQFEARLEDASFEELKQLASGYREALEQIAYPANHPPQYPAGAEERLAYGNRVRNWHQSVASNALTNVGRDDVQ